MYNINPELFGKENIKYLMHGHRFGNDENRQLFT